MNPISETIRDRSIHQPELRSLSISRLNITASHSERLSQLTQLTRVFVRNSTVADLAWLPALAELHIHFSPLSRSTIRKIAQHTSLQKLSITVIPLTDTDLQLFASLKSLRSLSLCDVRVTRSGFADFEPLATLETLGLEGCPIND
jgi:Leucine-rich repeat (LRR) protein